MMYQLPYSRLFDDNGDALVEVANQNFTLTNPIGITTTTSSDESGIISMELNIGDYQLEQTGLEDFYLYSSFSVSDEDLSFDLDYCSINIDRTDSGLHSRL